MRTPSVIKTIVMQAYPVQEYPLKEDWDAQGNVLVFDSWYRTWISKNKESGWNNDYHFKHDRHTHWTVLTDEPA